MAAIKTGKLSGIFCSGVDNDKFLFLALPTLSLTACAGNSAPLRSDDTARYAAPNEQPPEQLRIGGDQEAIGSLVMPAKETFEEENRRVTITATHDRPETLLAALLRNDLDAMVSTLSLEELESTAAAASVPFDPGALRSTPVGKSANVVFLNPRNSIKKLSSKQLRAIFSGKLTNWKQLSGANRDICRRLEYIGSGGKLPPAPESAGRRTADEETG